MTPTSRLRTAREIGLRLTAVFEAIKGALVLLIGSGSLFLVHRDVQDMAERFVERLHLDPGSHYPRIFLGAAGRATPNGLRLFAVVALVYAIIRFTEAVGLWRARRWAEWLGVASGLMYMPIEIRALIRHPSLEPMIALLLNIGVVVFLGLLLEGRESKREGAAAQG